MTYKYNARECVSGDFCVILCPRMKTFEELGVNDALLRAIREIGYESPMPVQEEVIPYLLGEGNDVIALAQTGTGKTAAFGLPVLQKIDTETRTTQAVILSPTRELCLQIAGDLKDYARYIEGLHVVAVYGGAAIDGQIRQLKRGAQVIVATPGRLIDLMNRGVAQLDEVRNVVLDEADEMLNMGFSESIDAILEGVPSDRNTLLFSATMGPDIERIAKSYLRDYKEIVVGSRNEGAENVNHTYYLVQAKDKYPALKRIVDYYPRIYAIIFCRTKIETQEIADQLIRDGYNAEALHGDLAQAQRDLTMQKFRQHRTQLLIATDVAARGLDVEDLTHVINYGLPDDVENYTHRSGRTGRAGKRGTSISIIHIREKSKVRVIERTIGKQFEAGILPEPQEICTKQLYRVMDLLEQVEVDETQIAPFLPEVMHKLEWLSKEDLVKRIVQREFGRFVAYYADAPEIVQPTESKSRKEKDSASPRRGKRGDKDYAPEPGYKRLFLNMGKRDNFYAREIINLVNRYVKGNVDIGRIDLTTSFSFFEVPEEQAQHVIDQMQRAKAGTRRVVVDWADPADGQQRPHGKQERKSRREDSANGNENPKNRRESRDKRREYRSDEWPDRTAERQDAPAFGRDDRQSRRQRKAPLTDANDLGRAAARKPKKNTQRPDAEPQHKTKRSLREEWKQFFED